MRGARFARLRSRSDVTRSPRPPSATVAAPRQVPASPDADFPRSRALRVACLRRFARRRVPRCVKTPGLPRPTAVGCVLSHPPTPAARSRSRSSSQATDHLDGRRRGRGVPGRRQGTPLPRLGLASGIPGASGRPGCCSGVLPLERNSRGNTPAGQARSGAGEAAVGVAHAVAAVKPSASRPPARVLRTRPSGDCAAGACGALVSRCDRARRRLPRPRDPSSAVHVAFLRGPDAAVGVVGRALRYARPVMASDVQQERSPKRSKTP